MTKPTLARFLSLTVLWGSSFTLIKVALEGLTRAQLVLGRLVLGALVLLVVIVVSRAGLPRGARLWRHIAVLLYTTSAA